jgi:hypothetical protein
MTARRMGRTQSIRFTGLYTRRMKPSASISGTGRVASMAGRLVAVEDPMVFLESGDCARLLRIILPVVMPFWKCESSMSGRCARRHMVETGGVAVTSNNDPSFPRFTRPFLRYPLALLFQSAESFLSGSDLQQSDLHPSIPHLRKATFFFGH